MMDGSCGTKQKGRSEKGGKGKKEKRKGGNGKGQEILLLQGTLQVLRRKEQGREGVKGGKSQEAPAREGAEGTRRRKAQWRPGRPVAPPLPDTSTPYFPQCRTSYKYKYTYSVLCCWEGWEGASEDVARGRGGKKSVQRGQWLTSAKKAGPQARAGGKRPRKLRLARHCRRGSLAAVRSTSSRPCAQGAAGITSCVVVVSYVRNRAVLVVRWHTEAGQGVRL